jgi:hypothetical protein
MSTFGNFFLNIAKIAGGIAAQTLLKRYQAFRVARRYAGMYAPEIIEGRSTKPMPGASPTTEFRLKGLWSCDPGGLDGYAYDSTVDGKREHDSHIVTDPSRPGHADRTVVYRKGFEVSQQKIELIDKDILVTPLAPGYHTHVLRRLKPPLFLGWS